MTPYTTACRSTRSLAELREEIERVDDSLIELIAQRNALARDVGAHKRANAQAILDPAREVSVVTRAAALGRTKGLPDDQVRALFWHIIALARNAQIETATEPPRQEIGDLRFGMMARPMVP